MNNLKEMNLPYQITLIQNNLTFHWTILNLLLSVIKNERHYTHECLKFELLRSNFHILSQTGFECIKSSVATPTPTPTPYSENKQSSQFPDFMHGQRAKTIQ